MAHMFLSTQKNLKDKVSTEQVSNARKNIEDNKTLSAVKKSGEMLDLNVKDIKLDVDKKSSESSKKITQHKDTLKSFMTNNTLLNKMIVEKQASQDVLKNVKDNISNLKVKEQSVIVDQKESMKDKEVVVNVTVPPQVVETIQNKIIGAQQKVGTFMSDLARSMYLNYKPPVNTFKINLNPANLGSISIVMKNNKADNSISVSMNMSNSSTMDAFSENKSILHSALMRNFNDSSNVNLSFNMQGDNSNSNFEQFNQQNQNNQNKEQIDQGIKSVEQEDEVVLEDNDYM